MHRIILLVLALSMVLAVPTMAARINSTMITHLEQVYQACSATSDDCVTFEGYEGTEADVISSAPGILSIEPQDDELCETPWANFVAAARDGVDYTIKNVTFTKEVPEYVQCAGIFPAGTITQQGTPNIRLWWPLMYEVPSTVFTLTILYGTPTQYDDDGLAGPNPSTWVHVEQWQWHVDATLESLANLLELFHELPYGKDEVPLISDEPLYDELQDKIAAASAAFENGDTATAASFLTDFELEVADACIDQSPSFPNPTGPGTGIANSEENPACCKLLVDIEYILQTTGIGQPSK